MRNLLTNIRKLFTYRRPVDTEGGFELLEDEFEKSDTEEVPSEKYGVNTGNPSNQEKSKKGATVKQPIKVEQWNKQKNNQGGKIPTSNMRQNIISTDLNVNKEYIRQSFSMPKNQDIVIREFRIARKLKAFIVFIDGMVDKTSINQFVLPQLMNPECLAGFSGDCPLDYIMEDVLSITQLTKTADFNITKIQALNGLSILFVDGCPEALMIETRGFEKRGIDRPITEQVVRGSQEGFTENLRTNLTLLRRIIKNEKLITEVIPVGKLNKINCAILYIEGVTNPKIVREVRRRIKGINIDFIEGNGMLEQLIEDNPFMLFPQVVTTERPDRASSFLAEGQVVIITESDPFAIAVPMSFFRLFHSSEDSMLRWEYGTFLRMIRLVGVLSALMIPGMYVALALYHHEMIPTPLLESIARMRENVPFPTIIELILMEISFELIREGGVRIPGVIGQTLGILGALILGQVAVAAGLASPLLIVIVALTGLGSFTMPNFSMAISIRILRFFFIFAGGIAGFYGISLAFILVAAIACHMKSFGVPFLTPVAPRVKINPDVIIRHPIFRQKMRSDGFNTPNRKRAGNNAMEWTKEKGGDDQ
ncbi:MAG TPA: spore germination protein [Pseudobacteroides sp.]|uniref:spore germination protein n=1 Tax=Pseudobacteroides sp. TaxID=1968840 RepID=UPI002F91C442